MGTVVYLLGSITSHKLGNQPGMKLTLSGLHALMLTAQLSVCYVTTGVLLTHTSWCGNLLT